MSDNIIQFPGAPEPGQPVQLPEPEPMVIRVSINGPSPAPQAPHNGVGLLWDILCGIVSFAVVTALLGGL